MNDASGASMNAAAPLVDTDDHTESASRHASRRVAFLPTVGVLGVVLPIAFLTWFERYLYYLHPLQLIPTYATAWLLLAAMFGPLSLLLWLTLDCLRAGHLWRVRSVLAPFVIWLTATALTGAFALAFLVWIRLFGFFPQLRGPTELAATSLCAIAGVVATATLAGRRVMARVLSVARYGAALGALSLASLPFSTWSSDTAMPPADDTPAPAAALDARPHVLLVTIDALSAQRMSLYGASRRNTPSLESFARTATVFDRAYANANFTTAGVSSILTGTRPWTHRALQLPAWPVSDALRWSLPALLAEHGYQMGYASANQWADASKNGFGSYFKSALGTAPVSPLSPCGGTLSAVLKYDCAAAELPPFSFIRTALGEAKQVVLKPAPNMYYDPRVVMGPALDWLASADRNRAVFLWVHLMPPHSPYAAPEPWLGRFDSSPAARDEADSKPLAAYLFRTTPPSRVAVLEARYDESIAYADHYVGEFLQRALQLLGPNTLVIVTADHGESFEHGYGMHTGPGLFEPLIHIPLIMRFPYQATGIRTDVTAEQIDIAPTVAALAHIAAPASWEGRSLTATSRSPAGSPELSPRPVFSMSFEQNGRFSKLSNGSVAVIEGRWKLVHYMGKLHYPLMPALHDELYDLSTDPGELHNLASANPGEVNHLSSLIDVQLAQHGGAIH